jgi:hypothetical protein
MLPFHPVDFESKSAFSTGWEALDLHYAENDDIERNFSRHMLQFTDDNKTAFSAMIYTRTRQVASCSSNRISQI